MISPCTYSETSSVIIPSSIASSILVPQNVHGNVKLQSIKEGEYGILVRQPIPW